jgi:hypothetical protein
VLKNGPIFLSLLLTERFKRTYSRHPADTDLNMTAVEYELQLLKILSVGWPFLFMLVMDKNKGPDPEHWENIREISGNISTLTQTTGKSADYFEI